MRAPARVFAPHRMPHDLAAILASFVAVALLRRLSSPVLEAIRVHIGPDRMLPASVAGGRRRGPFALLAFGAAGIFTLYLPSWSGFELVLGVGGVTAAVIAFETFVLFFGALTRVRKTFRIEAGAAYPIGHSAAPLRIIGIREAAGAAGAGPASSYRVYTLEIELADGARLQNAYLDQDVFERDRAALVERGSYREAAVRREGDALGHAPAPRETGGLAWLAFPLLVVATVASFIGLDAYTRLRPHRTSKVRAAQVGVKTVKAAAEIYVNIDGDPKGCPTIDELVRAKRLDHRGALDPWGTPYLVVCDGDDIHVRSLGADRRFGTADDVVAGAGLP